MGILCVRSFEEGDYETKFSEMIGLLRKQHLIRNELSLSLWCGSDALNDESSTSDHKYFAKDIDFHIHLRGHIGKRSKFFNWYHNIEV